MEDGFDPDTVGGRHGAIDCNVEGPAIADFLGSWRVHEFGNAIGHPMHLGMETVDLSHQ